MRKQDRDESEVSADSRRQAAQQSFTSRVIRSRTLLSIVSGSDENNEQSLTLVTRNNGSRISLCLSPQDTNQHTFIMTILPLHGFQQQ